MNNQKLIRVSKARISFYENLLQNHSKDMYQEDIDRFLILLSNAYKQLRTLEQESNDTDSKTP